MHLYLHLGGVLLLCLRLRLRWHLLCFAFFFRLATIGAPRTLQVQGVFSGCIAWPNIGANPVLRKSLPIRRRKAKKERKKRDKLVLFLWSDVDLGSGRLDDLMSGWRAFLSWRNVTWSGLIWFRWLYIFGFPLGFLAWNRNWVFILVQYRVCLFLSRCVKEDHRV